jgi:hypothetical protein
MNWIFDAYSNVYTAAMMQAQSGQYNAATAKERSHVKRSSFFGIFARR